MFTIDGFVKSPDAALRQAQGRLSSVHGELVEPRALPVELFTEPSNLACFSTFYEFITIHCSPSKR